MDFLQRLQGVVQTAVVFICYLYVLFHVSFFFPLSCVILALLVEFTVFSLFASRVTFAGFPFLFPTTTVHTFLILTLLLQYCTVHVRLIDSNPKCFVATSGAQS